ncbi:MAG: AMP-binding protein [Pseudomonadota bacterium]
MPECILADTDLIARWELPPGPGRIIIPVEPRKQTRVLHRILGRRPQATTAFPDCLDRLKPEKPQRIMDPESDAYILFTSGTTSEPKGVRISHRALFSHLKTLSAVYRMDSSSRIFNNLILSHADGIAQGPLLALFNQATLFRPFGFAIQTIEETIDTIFRDRISHWVMVPTMMALINQLFQENPDLSAAGDFKYVISCGGKLETGVWQKLEEKFNVRVINGYGLTETVAGGLFAGPGDDTHVIGTLGRPVDCEARIVGDDSRTQPQGIPGELWLRGSLLMSGYVNAPELNREVFRDGWLRTGDLACQGDDGCYRILGRMKSVIISGGVTICPEEVTEVLNSHPGVQEAVTFGVVDEIWGERVVCALVPLDNGLTLPGLMDYCRSHLEERKIPSQVFMVDHLPKGRSGKVMLPAVREMVLGEDGTGSEQDPIDLDLENRFLGVVSRCFQMNPKDIDFKMQFNDTPQWDSIAHLTLIAGLEKEFGIEFNAAEVMGINALTSMLSTVKEKVGGP